MSDEVILSRSFYGKPVVLATYKNIIIQKNAHLQRDIRIMMYNEKFQTNTVIRLSDVLIRAEPR